MSYFDCCKECTKRHLSCHSTCDDYKIQKDEYMKKKQTVIVKRDLDSQLSKYVKDKSYRLQKQVNNR